MTGKLLIVDDSAFNRELLCRQMGRMGFHCETAADGPTALSMLVQDQYDVVLLDLIMPVLSGIEVLKSIRQTRSMTDLAVIMVTAVDNTDDIVTALACGANDYVTKPVSLPVVQARVHTQLMMKQMIKALEAANLKLANLSYLDGLTGIANRRAFDECLAREWRRAGRESTPLSVIIVDIDCFKPYNDHFGHEAGDTALKQVARALAQSAERAGDKVARYGGEEFAAVLPDTDAAGAFVVAERMRGATLAMNIPHPHSLAEACLTISVGVSTATPTIGMQVDYLVDAADRALYQAKRAGRNQVRACPASDTCSLITPAENAT